MGNIGGGEIFIVLLAALIFLGPAKLPDAARQIGKAMGEFRKVTAGFQRELRDALNETTTVGTTTTTTTPTAAAPVDAISTAPVDAITAEPVPEVTEPADTATEPADTATLATAAPTSDDPSTDAADIPQFRDN